MYMYTVHVQYMYIILWCLICWVKENVCVLAMAVICQPAHPRQRERTLLLPCHRPWAHPPDYRPCATRHSSSTSLAADATTSPWVSLYRVYGTCMSSACNTCTHTCTHTMYMYIAGWIHTCMYAHKCMHMSMHPCMHADT